MHDCIPLFKVCVNILGMPSLGMPTCFFDWACPPFVLVLSCCVLICLPTPNPLTCVCVVKTVYHALNNKKKNFDAWFDAMGRAKLLAKKRAHNYADRDLAAAGSLLAFNEGAVTTRKRTRKPSASFAITVNTRVRVRWACPSRCL